MGGGLRAWGIREVSALAYEAKQPKHICMQV